MRYFLKEQVGNKVRTDQGWPIPFETVSFDRSGNPDYGALATEDKYLLSQLDDFARRKVGGVRETDHDDYEDWLKKKQETPSPVSLNEQGLPHLRFHPLAMRPSTDLPNAAVAPEPPPPIEVPKEFTKPKLGRPRKFIE